MPRSTPMPIRQMILQRSQHGQGPAAIAEELGIPLRTVRHLLRRFTEDDLAPAYGRCGRPKQPPRPVIQEAFSLRQQHPTWGAGLIRVILVQTGRRSEKEIPCERTLQRWLRRLNASAAPPGRRPEAQRDRAESPHEVWQVDAADQMRLKTGRQASWLRVVDECSGAVLKTVVFSRGKLGPGAAGGDATGDARLVHSMGNAPTTPS